MTNVVIANMEAEQSQTWLCPAVQLFKVGKDGTTGAPEVLFVRESILSMGRTNTPDLVIVCGPLSTPCARVQAVRISGSQAGSVLLVAVLELQEDMPPAATHLQELYDAFDAVVVVDSVDRAQLVRRLVRAITAPGGPDQWIACDWNDVRYVVSGSADARPARYGFGRGVGGGRAIEATVAAIEHMASQGGAGLGDARGVCVAINAAPTDLHGREIKEVMGRIRAGIHPAASVVQSVGYDSSLDAGTLEVDIFAFGECDASLFELAGAQASESVGIARQDGGGSALDGRGQQQLGIPEFLRRR